MNNSKRHSPHATALRRNDAVSNETVTRFKNSRRRRVQIRERKYTCEAKLHAPMKTRSVESVEISLLVAMASTLSSEKEDRWLKRNDEVLSYGTMSVTGNRKEMEDAVSVEIGFVSKERRNCDFFAVYDGHGGAQVAEVCRERLHRLVAEGVERYGRRSGNEVEWDWEDVMEGCFGKMDREVGDVEAVRTVGTTAIVAVVAEEEIVVANCGDSRAVMGRGGEALDLSCDHKPDRPDELMRIEEAGGRVINWNGHRVLGVLATSRSIGDQYLQPYVISKPEVTVTKRTSKDEFLILASDGLWDVISSDFACKVVRKCLNSQSRQVSDGVGNQSRAAKAAALLVKIALAKGSRDNTSVIVIELRGTTTTSS
ncbi:hypothetical protein TanjilG_15652 [Lupinus angustifolius]|uniref:protein-serine/threonine phosphatase n=1 Tax=Lupinus angustifolius TaxID=3871 RepID=A0A1J7IW77_LUPAN|nr:PREDICTED: probable protein phosphatase 2C 8 [Lupinus angustifolius]OIW17069.1 hypothetical protein TanjilG_15652 [Lupinus angustifolius]